MPKMLKISLFMITLVSLLFVLSCGSGDKGGAGRVNPLQVVTGTTGTLNETGIGGGGGGATGSCVVSMSGLTIGCYGGVDQTTCNAFTAGGGSVSFTAGQTCQNLGYTNCSSVGAYTLCQ